MNKILKRLLSVVLAVVMVVGLVPLSGPVTVEAAGETKVIYLHGTKGTAPYQAKFSGNGSVNQVPMIQVADGYYRATVPSGKTTVMFVDKNGNWLANGNNWPVIPTDNRNCFEPYDFGKDGWSWSTYNEGGGADTEETFMVNADLWDYFNNHRVGADGQSYSDDNEGNGTDKNEPVYSAWNYVIAGNDGSNKNTPTYPLYFGGLGHKTNRKMQQVTDHDWIFHGLPNFSLTANVALSDKGHAAVQGAVGNQLVNGNLTDPVKKDMELPYFSKTPLYNNGKQVTAYYPNLQFPFKKTTSANGQTTYSYDSATDYAVYYDYNSHKLYKSDTHSYNTAGEGEVNEWGYYPFDNNKGYNPGPSGDGYNEGAANKRNMGFGTKFTIPFTLSMDENGQINGQDVIFSFTGDDDVWVFIDDVLVLDMGGAHYKASGQIDFTHEKVTVDQAYGIQQPIDWTDGNFDEDATHPSWDQPSSTTAGVNVAQDVKEFSNITGTFTGETGTKTLADILADDTKVHTLTMFYMERGMYDSNMSISFTFNPVPSGLVLSKEVDTANVNAGLAETVKTKDYFDFKIEKAGYDSSGYSAASGIQYTKEYDGAGSENATTTAEGVVENLADNIYAHDFRITDESGNITRPFALGDKLKITETGFDSSKYSTKWRVWDLRENKLIAEENDGNPSNDTMAQFTLGTYTGDIYAPGVNYAVNFVNTPKVANLSLEKRWSSEESSTDTYEFTIKVDLNGGSNFQPYELTFTSTDDTREDLKTGADGKVSLKVGEKITFAGIPVGATYSIEETKPSANDNDIWAIGSIEMGQGTSAEQDADNKYLVTGTILEESEDDQTTTGENETVENAITFINKDLIMEDDQIVIDYGKPVTIDILNNETDSTLKNATVVGFQDNDGTPTGSSFKEKLSTEHGEFSIEEKKVVYKLTKFLDAVDTVYCVVEDDGRYVLNKLDVIPATNMYYESDFGTGIFNFNDKAGDDNGWKTKDSNGSTVTEYTNIVLSQDDGTIGIGNRYGFDSHYATAENSKLSDGFSKYVKGNGRDYTTAEFSFNGTGFDIISRTGAQQGIIRVDVYSDADHINKEKSITVLNKSDTALELYQIPVVSIEGLDADTTHYVVIGVSEPNTDAAYEAMRNGGQFYFDAIRIYNPIDVSAGDSAVDDAAIAYAAYKKDGEANASVTEVRNMLLDAKSFGGVGEDGSDGVVFVDKYYNTGTEGVEVSDYKTIGPNNEVYLSYGQAILFEVKTTDIPASIDVGAKSANGQDVQLGVTIMSTDMNYENSYSQEINSSTAQYYDLLYAASSEEQVSAADIFGTDKTAYIFISNNKEDGGVLSITDFKVAFGESGNGVSYSASNNLIEAARNYIEPIADDGDYDVKSAEFTSSSCARNKYAELHVTTTKDVESLEILDKSGNKVNAEADYTDDDNGLRTWTVTFKVTLIGNQKYTVTGYSTAGTAGASQTASLKVTLR